VCIIGAQISGVAAAHFLTGHAKSVVLIDDDGSYSAAETFEKKTDFLQSTSNFELFAKVLQNPRLAREIRKNQLFEKGCKKRLRDVIVEKNIKCDHVQEISAFHIFETQQDLLSKLASLRWFSFLFRLFGAKLLSSDETKELLDLPESCPNAGALLIKNATDALNSRQFLQHFLNESLQQGLKLLTGIEIEKVERNSSIDGSLCIHTSRGAIRCKEIIYATNNGIEGILPEDFKGKIEEVTSHTLVLRDANSVSKSMECTLSFPRSSIRAMSNGSETILSGFQEFDCDQESNIKESRLALVEEYFPGHEVIGEWSCRCTTDGDPWIGALPYSDHEYIIAGFAEHTFARQFVAGEMVARMSLQEQIPSALQNFWSVSFSPQSRARWWRQCYNERICRQMYQGAFY